MDGGAVCHGAMGNGVLGDMRGDAVRGMNGGAVCHDAVGNGVRGDMRGEAVQLIFGCYAAGESMLRDKCKDAVW